MNYSTSVFLINNHVRAIIGVYEPEDRQPKPTMFKTLDPSISVGDLVVVPTDTRHGMTVVKVSEVDADVDFDNTTVVKWVIQKVDRTAFDKTTEEERIAIETIKSAVTTQKRAQLRDAMLADTGNASAIRTLALADMGEKPKAERKTFGDF